MCNYVMFTVQSLSMSYVDKGDNNWEELRS